MLGEETVAGVLLDGLAGRDLEPAPAQPGEEHAAAVAEMAFDGLLLVVAQRAVRETEDVDFGQACGPIARSFDG